MNDRWRFLRNRLREQLWLRPLLVCVLSIGVVFLAKLADLADVERLVPEITPESVDKLLEIMSASMLVIATFAVGSMVAAYSSAGRTATPRSFPLIIADDVSQNALSAFVGAFIYSIVAIIAVENGYYERAGRFVLFALTLAVFAVVILTFVKWVDDIARLGRLGPTVKRVEASAMTAMERRRSSPRLGGVPVRGRPEDGEAVYSDVIGYVQRVELLQLQAVAERCDVDIVLAALPGTFACPGREIAVVKGGADRLGEADLSALRAAFAIDADRTFDEDPRFGLVVLSEIACRALSPAVNDPGTAIDVIGSFVRLFSCWLEPTSDGDAEASESACPRIEVPLLSLDDMFEDAFRGLSRDGAGNIEVAVRLQKALHALAGIGGAEPAGVARRHARAALERAEAALVAPDDVAALRSAAEFVRRGA